MPNLLSKPARAFDPRVILLAFCSVAVWVMTARTPAVTALAAIVLLGMAAGCHGGSGPWRELGRLLRWILPMAILVLLLYLLFGPDKGTRFWSWGPVAVPIEALVTGARLAMRLIAFVALARVVGRLMTPAALAAGLTRLFYPLTRLGVHVESLYHVVLFMMRMVTVLVEEARIIRLGQRSRGIRFDGSLSRRVRASTSIIIPVFAAAMRRSERLALTLASRGYDPRLLPQSVLALCYKKRDRLAMAALLMGWFFWIVARYGIAGRFTP